MRRFGPNLFRAGALAAALVIAASPSLDLAAQDSPLQLPGRCNYSDKYAPLVGKGYAFALCDAVSISRSGGRGWIDFRNEGRGSSYLFAGEFAGDAMTVTSLRIREREPIAVSGECRLFRRDGDISVVTCIVTDKRTTYAANFERS